MKQIIFLAVVLTFFIPLKSKSQGCSDVGFCTIGTLKPQSESDSAYRHSATLSFSFGIGDEKTKIYQVIPELELRILKNNSLQIKMPFVSVRGNLGDNSGVGDISFSMTQTVKETDNTKFNFTLGFKFPTGTTAELTTVPVINPVVPLPMHYQTGLGTTDLILGASMKYKKW
ncbi:MAG TPA: hypothetical protein VI757_15990, partial [Bacteroidia bacterium]|nr:hypothetical protein [Bacteroidia bacterium]